MSPEKDKRFTEDFVRKWSRAGEERKKKQVSKNERILRNQEEILKRNPRNHKIWFARGTLLVEMGRHEEAIRCFDAVIKLDPKNRAVYNAKASALMRMGDTDEAVKWYRKALAVTSEDVDRKLTETLSEEAPVEEILRQMSEESKEWEVKVETRTCPICAATVKKETKICPSCDWEFYDEELEKKVFAEEEVKPERELTEKEMRERLIQKVETFRMQGFEVGPLVRTIRTEPHRARSATEQFEENAEKVKEYRKQLEGMDTTRFESKVKELETLFRSPYNIFVIRKEFDKLVSRVKARRARKAPPSKVGLKRKPPAVGLTNGRRGRVNGLVKDRKAIGLTNGRTGRVNGLVNGRGRVNGITNGLGMVNGITNGLTYRFQTMKTGLVNGLTNGNGITNGLGSIRFRNESKMRRWKVAIIPIVAFALLILPFLFVSEVPISDIEIDGGFDDWNMVPKIPSTPNGSPSPDYDNIDILYEAAWRNHRFISLYVEVANIALLGNPAMSSPDTFHALLDVDNDIETGYVVGGIGADYMVRIRGYGGNVLSSQLHRYGSESDQVNWSSWQKVGNVKSAVSLKSLETQVPLSSLEAAGPRIAVLFHTQGYDNLYDFSDHVISGQGGVLEIDQRWSNTIRTISGASNRILDIYARAIGRDVHLDSLTIHLMGDAELSEIDMLRLSMDGLDIATISPPFTSRDQTFQFSSKRIGEGGTAVLSVDTTVIGSSENTLAAKVSSSGDVGMTSGIASLKTVIPTGYMGYVGNYPSQVEIDGGFHEWTVHDTDPQDQVNPNIDIVRFASVRINATQLLVHTYFYLDVAGVMAGGSLVPYTSPGPVKEQVYAPDSDRDTVPDSIDQYDHDFNNNMIPDSQTNFDVDEDMVQDYPRGPDCWLETILQDFFPDPYKGREVRVNTCPSGPSRVTGEDYINIFIDIDGDVEGYAVGPIFADYLLQITGKNNDITSKEFLKYKRQGPLEWEPIGSAPEVDWDTQRLEAHVEITGRTFDMFEVFFEASDWKDLTDDATDVTRGGRSVSEGSFGDFDARFSSPSYESYFTDQADKVSFRRRSNYITWSLPKEIRLEDGTDSRVVGELEPSYLTMDDNGAVYPNAYSRVDVSIEYIFEDTKLKENIVLEKAFEDMTERGVISLSSRLEYSETLVVYAEGEETEEWTVVSGGLTFLERDSARFHISLPYAVDSQGDILDCRYLFNAKEGLLDLHCPTDWFLTATYPVKIDPSVTTYTIENDGTLGQATEYFGWSVAIGDFDNDGYADIATGAPWADVGSNTDAGAVYIYFGPISANDASPDVWIVANNTGAHLGWAIAAGKFNNDDYWDLVITQLENDAYAYYGYPGWIGWDATPNVTFDLSQFEVTGSLNFGNAVAVGNIDYDGTALNFDDVVIGANLSDSPGDGPGNLDGMAYVFVSVFATTETSYDAILYPVDDSKDGEFATSLACGKIDNDNKWDVVAGEPMVNTSDGAVHILYGDNIGTTGGAYYTDAYLEDESADEMFGLSVAVGSMDSDSYDDILVGAPENSEYGSSKRGRAYVYQANTDGSGVTDSAAPDYDLAGPDVADGAEFGYSVAIGDFEGDGVGDAIVGARYNASGGTKRGSIAIFDDPITTNNVTDYFIDGTQNDEYLGWSVTARKFSSDLEMIIAAGAASWDDSGETDAGRVMVMLIPEFLDTVLVVPFLLAIPIALKRRKRKSLQFGRF